MSLSDNTEKLQSILQKAASLPKGEYIPVPATAKVGQTVRVTAVDDTGKPTAWEAADLNVEVGASSWNDLTDKPFYSKVTEVLPETTVAIDQSNLSVDMKTRLDIVDGGTYTVNWNGTEYVCVAKDVEQFGVVSTLLGNYAYNMGTGDTGEPFMIAVYDEETAAQYGGYATCIYAFDGSASVTLSVTGEVVKKLDPKYLYQPDWEQTDKAAPDFVKNKPFYEETTTVGGDTLTWDGNTEGLVTVADMYFKVSDATPTFAELESAVLYMGGEIAEYGFRNLEENLVGHSYGFVLVALADNVGNEDMMLPEKGIYFIRQGDDYVTSLTIPGYTGFVTTKTVVKPIDQKFLPEHLQFGETAVGGDTLTWDGNTEGKVSAAGMLYKVADAVPTTEAFANGGSLIMTVVTPEGVLNQGQQFAADDVVTTNEGIVSAANAIFVPETALNIELEDLGGASFTEAGTYFFYQEQEGGYVYISSLTIPGYTGFVTKTVKPLDEKYLPDNVKTPAVTADDNGKFLRVVDGAWAAEAVPNAEEASF